MKKAPKALVNVIMIVGPDIHETKSSQEYIKQRVASNHLKRGETGFSVDDVEVMCHEMITECDFESKFKVTSDWSADVKNNRKVVFDMAENIGNVIFVFDGCKPPLEMHEALMVDDYCITDPRFQTLTIFRDDENKIVRGIAVAFND